MIATESVASRRPHLNLVTAYYGMRLASQAGQGVFFAGLFLLAGKQDGALGVSGLFAGMMAAAIMFGLLGGAAGDRLGAGRAVVAGAAGRGAAIGMGLALATIPALRGHFELAALVAFLYSAASQLYCPAELALAVLVSPRRPGRAHAALVALQYGGQGAGMALLAPVAYFLGGTDAMLAVGLATYAIVTGLALVTSRRLGGDAPKASSRHAFRLRATAHYYLHQPGAVYAGVLLAFGELSMKAMAVALPVYFSRDLGLNPMQTVFLVVPGALGAVGALTWAARSLHPHAAEQVMRMALIGTIVGVLALAGLGDALAELAGFGSTPLETLNNGTAMSLAVALPVSVLLGICFGVAPVGGRTLLSATAPHQQQSRVFAMQSTVTDVLAIAPTFLAGVGVELVGARSMFAVLGVAGLGLFFLLESAWMRGATEPGWRPAAELAG